MAWRGEILLLAYSFTGRLGVTKLVDLSADMVASSIEGFNGVLAKRLIW